FCFVDLAQLDLFFKQDLVSIRQFFNKVTDFFYSIILRKITGFLFLAMLAKNVLIFASFWHKRKWGSGQSPD
ncbi:MAG: hypothetical protein NC084_09245, partial [Bacteroides sp.]|nr:hypothetical protein [Eubacterium sp.]MCM1418997.1 hypothetical protein [Roseburia sp.]MCM1462881.1 hypothetical protein [Bacteroides sp.]